MLGMIREVWVWGWGETAAETFEATLWPTVGRRLVCRPMRMGRMHFDGIGDPSLALEDAERYVENLLGAPMTPAPGDVEPVLCLQHFADNDGEGLNVPGLFPYWALVGHRIAELLFDHYGPRTPPGIALHSEDRTGGTEEDRDVLLDAAIAWKLRRYWPDLRMPAYRSEASRYATPSNSKTYTTLRQSVHGYALAGSVSPPAAELPGHAVIPWLARPGHLRNPRKLPGQTEAQRRITGADFASQLVLAAEHGAETVILWGPRDANAQSWAATWRTLADLLAANHGWASDSEQEAAEAAAGEG